MERMERVRERESENGKEENLEKGAQGF